jgi:hypothetical protein
MCESSASVLVVGCVVIHHVRKFEFGLNLLNPLLTQCPSLFNTNQTASIAKVFHLFLLVSCLAFVLADAAFHHSTPRPAIVRIVALPMSDPQETFHKTFDYYESTTGDEEESQNRKSISAAPSFDEYMKQRATGAAGSDEP